MSMRQWLEAQLSMMESALKGLVEVNSFTGNVDGGQRLNELLVQLFDVPGLTHERIRSTRFADHLVFRADGVGAPVGLVGHSDTVFPPGVFEGYRIDGALRRGPGVLDMKGGLVVMAFALKALAKQGLVSALPPLRVVVVSDEEVGSPEGALVLQQALSGARACLVFESGRANDAIVTRRKGTGACICVAHGKAAHAGNDFWAGSNAIWAMSRFVDGAQRLSNREDGTTVNVGIVRGGTTKNTVAAECTAELDLRVRSGAEARRLWAGLEQVANEAADAVPGTRFTLTRGPHRPPLEPTAATHTLLASYAQHARAQGLGADEAPEQGGGSDANTAAALGIPSIDGLGPRGRGFHTHDEYIELASLAPKAAALAEWLAAQR
jgi:glutamate carboxypeptidase